MRKYTLIEDEITTKQVVIKINKISFCDLMTGINYEKAIFGTHYKNNVESLEEITNKVLINLHKSPNYYKNEMI